MNRVEVAVHTIMKAIKLFLAVAGLLSGISISASAQTPLQTLDGGSTDVQAQKGKVVVLAVGASWLALSGKQAEFTNALARKYAGKNVVIYFVATDSTNPKSKTYATNDELRRWAATNKLTVAVLRDPDGAAIRGRFGVDQVPAFVVLDKNGDKSGDAFGGIDPKYDITVPISKKIDSLL